MYIKIKYMLRTYNDKIDQWVVESGKYTLSIGTSASDIIDQYNVKIEWKWDENEKKAGCLCVCKTRYKIHIAPHTQIKIYTSSYMSKLESYTVRII